MSIILAIDIGTSRVKAALIGETGQFFALRSCRIDRASSPVTQDPEEYWRKTASLIRELSKEPSFDPDCLVLTGNMHALLGIGKDGMAVEEAVLWSDNSASEESDRLNRDYGSYLKERFGNLSIPVFTLPKILRMQHLRPDRYEKTETFLLCKDYITLRLTGNRLTDPSDASGVLGMDLRTRQWDRSFLPESGADPEKFPEIRPSASEAGKVTAEAASLTGLKEGTPVVTGCGDLLSAALGSGVTRHRLSLTLGTAGQLLGEGPSGAGKALAGKLFLFAHASPEKELYLGSVPSGGFSFEWLSRQYGISVPDFFREAEKAALSPDQPCFLPYLLGRGAPSMDYTPCGGWYGLNALHTRSTLCRSAIFGTLCPLRQCTDLLEECLGPCDEIVFQALASREPTVRECAGQLFRQQKYLPENSEASLLGAAVLGAVFLKLHPDTEAAQKAMVRSIPCEEAHTPLAEKLYQRFLRASGFFGKGD